jgi:radical SAM protein with 4Fe4S-binding SPASM domain
VRPPEAVQWIATTGCELRCPHCYSHAGGRSRGELTADEAKRLIVDELVRLDRPTLVLAGGEPLNHPGFAAVVEHAHRRGVPWAMHSHGGRVAAMEDLFRRCPPRMAAISLDGPRAHHDRFRGREGSFDAALAAIAALKRAGCPEVVAGTTITRDNADLLVDMVPIVLASGADSWGFHLMTPEGRGHDHRELLATPDQLRRTAALGRRLRSLLHVELDNEWGSAGEDDAFYRDDPFRCGAGRWSCVVSATGEVVACTTTDPDESQGNVREEPLADIWAGGFAAFRGRTDPLRGDRLDCWLQTRNGHSCRAAAFGGSLPSGLASVGGGPARAARIAV